MVTNYPYHERFLSSVLVPVKEDYNIKCYPKNNSLHASGDFSNFPQQRPLFSSTLC